jgi:hypothetical protein
VLLDEKQLLRVGGGPPEVGARKVDHALVGHQPLAVEAAVQHLSKRWVNIGFVR